jgi:hypothetical protein
VVLIIIDLRNWCDRNLKMLNFCTPAEITVTILKVMFSVAFIVIVCKICPDGSPP